MNFTHPKRTSHLFCLLFHSRFRFHFSTFLHHKIPERHRTRNILGILVLFNGDNGYAKKGPNNTRPLVVEGGFVVMYFFLLGSSVKMHPVLPGEFNFKARNANEEQWNALNSIQRVYCNSEKTTSSVLAWSYCGFPTFCQSLRSLLKTLIRSPISIHEKPVAEILVHKSGRMVIYFFTGNNFA